MQPIRHWMAATLGALAVLAAPAAIAQAPAAAVKVGVIGPFTGPSSDFGIPLRQGIELAVAEINTALFLAGAGELGEALEDISSGRAVGPPAAGRYRGFPSGDEVAKARRAGVRLCGLWYAIRLIAAAVLPSYRRSGSGRFRQ